MKSLLAIATLALGCGRPVSGPAPSHAANVGAVRLAPGDVTIIWPMPADAAQRDSLLAADSAGRYGALLPAALYVVPVLDERDTTATDPLADRARLRVVAARLDPCHGSFGSVHDASCVNQLRLVLQVLRPGGGTGDGDAMGANDGAVLASYRLSREELLGLARDLAAMRAQAGGASDDVLGIHPLLARDGLGSESARALQATLLAHVGAERLTRVAFFTRTRAREPQWLFGASNIVDGKAVPAPIATLGAERQKLEGAGPMKVISPVTSSADNPATLLSAFGRKTATPTDRTAYAAVLRIENPQRHSTDTIACAECHAAERMHATGDALGLQPTQFADDAFRGDLRSATAGKIDPENFHAISYLGTNLAVTTRTANDTSAVLASMRALL